MICTEKEAAGLWCPQARAQNMTVTANRIPGGKMDPDSQCIGSRCMMWEWVDYDTETAAEYIGYDHTPHQKGRDAAEQRLRDGWEEYDAGSQFGSDYRTFKRPHTARRGTCGLIHRVPE